MVLVGCGEVVKGRKLLELFCFIDKKCCNRSRRREIVQRLPLWGEMLRYLTYNYECKGFSANIYKDLG